MRIEILVEGRTETAFKPFLLPFLGKKLAGKMPSLAFAPYDGRIPTQQKLKRVVERLLSTGRHPADAVIALTDVYTGKVPPDFATAEDAKKKMREWVGPEARFYPHVALHDFEAWLLPYWDRIRELTGCNRQPPGRHPERVNHGNSPAHRLQEAFRIGTRTQGYIKTRDAGRILKGQDLGIAVDACPELRAFVNTIIKLSGGTEL
ncbi:DUF4276 family protein [Aquisphaera insulae]|uniref:DUF4276 family protein n=1 Tax=Aquisphaera insulae TaxID=2712864 RepID=UPI0013EA9357|nr:DUF4276 family protein [Aquisphaera insulae]